MVYVFFRILICVFCVVGLVQAVRKAQPFTEGDLWKIMNRLEEWKTPLAKSNGHHGDAETYRDRVIIGWGVVCNFFFKKIHDRKNP